MMANRTGDRSQLDRRRPSLYARWLVGVLVAVLAPAAVGVAATPAHAGAPQAGSTLHMAASAEPAAVPGEIVVGFRSGVDGSERAAARSAADVNAKRNLLARGGQLVKVERGQTVDEAIAALEQRADVRYAEPNWIYHAESTTPDDARFGGLWGLENTGQAVNGRVGTADVDLDAPEAWEVNRGSASTVVAVVDSGVAFEHPDLAPNMWSNPGEIADNDIDDDGNGMVDDVRGWDFVGDDDNPWDYVDHGTHVAGTIAARGNNGVGITGVAWQASIMDARALNASGSGSNADIADAFTYAAANGAKVVNASLGGPGSSQALSDAITNHPDTLFVVSAGNSALNNETTASYPCNYTAANLICVAATDNTDALASFSNYGATSVDLAAPGVDIDSARPHYLPDAFADGFESSLDKWTVQSGPWGRVTIPNNSLWLTDSPNVNYANNADYAIRTSSKVDVGEHTDCVMKFRYGSYLEAGFDWLWVQSSTDGTAWTDLARIGDTNGAIRSVGVELGAGGSRYYRYRLTSDEAVVKSGVYIDNVRIACPGGPYGSDDYQLLSGTSMASPHVAGAAAVLFSHKPSATVADIKAALLDTGDPIAALSGKTVSGRRLNLNAALMSPAIRANTTSVINSHDPDPSVIDQAVTVHYSVTSEAQGAGTPTGNVTVSDGTESCTGTVAAGQCTLVFTTAGRRSLTATYSGDDAYYNASPSSAGVSHQVQADTTSTITADDPDSSVAGEPVTVNFAVTPVAPQTGTPTGDVTVSDGVDSCTATVAAGQCTLALNTVGSRTLTADYAGDDNFRASTSAGEPHTTSQPSTPGGQPPTGDPASNPGGQSPTGDPSSTPGGQPPTGNPPSTPPAHVSGASMTHRRFRVSPTRRLAQISRRRPPVGTTFKYTLDSAATVRFDFTRPGAGRKAGGKCVSVNKHNRRKPKCVLQRGSLTFAGHAGLNTVRFAGWLSRTNKLTPGKYALSITAITPGGATSQQLRFTIVR
jgi:subtilisin family serine protease